MFHLKPRKKPSFCLECFTVSEAAKKSLTDKTIRDALLRHQRGEWGSVNREQRKWNDASLRLEDGDLESVFKDTQGTRFRITTNRFHTCARVSLANELS
jgi:hypothetical protein